jgi:Family of unknown function (DUF5330)
MFFIRAVFWLTLLVAFIPVNPADLKDGQRAVSTGETIVAAQALVSDLSGFCERNEQACGTGKELFSQLGAKALTGARHVIRYLEQNAGEDAPAPDKISTGSLAPDQPKVTANP